MMMCRCAERKEAMRRAAIATANGDHVTAREEMALVMRTAREDLAAWYKKKGLTVSVYK